MDILKNIWAQPGVIEALSKLFGGLISLSLILKFFGFLYYRFLAWRAYESLLADLRYVTTLPNQPTMRDVRSRENRLVPSMRTAELMAKYTLHYPRVSMRTRWGSLVDVG